MLTKHLRPKSRTKITVYLPSFRDAFSWASERRLHMFYDAVADELSAQLPEMRQAGGEQLEMLARIAAEIGLPELAAGEPLHEKEDERLAQRIEWRTAARWTVLSLLFTLAEKLAGAPHTPEEWANAVPIEEHTQLLGGGDLSIADKSVALGFAAAVLAGHFAEQDSALLIRGRSLLVHADDAVVTATEVRPQALIAAGGELAAGELPLRTDDRIWPAPDQTELGLDGEYEEQDESWMMTGEGVLRIGERNAYAPVVQDIVLLSEADPSEDPR
ncbi:MAG TPA: hypothetical protein VHS55_03305 [Solirubrobacteraceae bacterium]|nr:hypothetical protein [Solirubrobacteraceae bacterium]